MSKYTTILEAWRLQADIERRAEADGIAVHFNDKNTAPHATRNAVYLPRPSFPLQQEELESLKAASIHESLHIVRSEIFDVLEEYGADGNATPITQLINCVEDHVMERQQSIVYRGDAYDLGVAADTHCERFIGINEENKGREPTKESGNLFGVIAATLKARQPWDTIGGGKADIFVEGLPTSVRAVYDKLDSAGIIEELNTAVTVRDSVELAKKIYEIVYDEPPPTPEENKAKAEAESGKPEEGEGEPEEGEGEGEGAKAGEDGDGDEEGEAVRYEIPWDQIKLSSDEHHKEGHHEESRVNWRGHKYREDWAPHPPNNVRVTDLDTTRKPNRGWTLDKTDGRAFSNQVRRLIQATMRSKFVPEKETGKIHARNLYRIATPMVGDGSWNRKIFKKRQESKKINTAVTVLVDFSGSMSGVKMLTANHAAQHLNEVFAVALNVPLEVLAFTTVPCGPHMGVVKTFAKRITGPEIASKLTQMNDRANGNADADSLLWAADRLTKRGEQRKILIVLSDGSPTDCFRGHAGNGLMKVCKELQSRKDLELYGIGIRDNNVKKFYGDNAKVIKEVSELNHVLLDTLKDVVVRNM